MIFIWLVLLVILILALIGAVFGAPYLPTLSKQVEIALDLANLQKNDTILELGCGDGKFLIAAAKRQIKSVGYEINPVLAVISYLRTIRYRKYITVIWGDFWSKPWPQADAVFVFLITRYMPKLNKQLVSYKHKPLKVVSFAFKIPDKKIKDEKSGVYLYTYD